MWGAITLQGPHQVAMQSSTMRPGEARAVSKSALLWGVLVGWFFNLGGGRRRGEGRYVFRLWTPFSVEVIFEAVVWKVRSVVLVRMNGVMVDVAVVG